MLWQTKAAPPPVAPFAIAAATTPRRFLARVVLSAWRLSIPAAVLAVAWQVGESLVPIVMGVAIDRALATGDAAQLALWLAVLALVFLVLSLAYRFSAQLTALAIEQVQHRLRVTLSRAVLHPLDGGGHRPDGGVVSLMTNDVARLAAVGLTVYPIAELSGVAFIAASLLLIHWPLGVAVLLGAPIAVWLMIALSGRLARDSRAYQELLADTVGRATDLVTGYRVVKGIRAEGEATRRYRETSRKTLAGARRNVGILGRFLAGSRTVSGVFVAAVAALCGWYAVTGDLSIGGMIAAVGLAQALLSPMQALAQNAVPTWAGAIASGSRVLDAVKDATAFPSGTATGLPMAGGVPVVTVSIPERADLRVAPGELVGVRVDDRAAADIADALLEPRANRVVRIGVGGVPAENLDPATYRSHVVVAPHHAMLFSGTVADNLAPSGTASVRLDDALTAAACDDFIAGVGGMTAPVGEMGNRLSGGQCQRVALARALASDAPVLVLHDPTTAVDSVTEAVVASRLRAARRNRSTILIARSPALLNVCDRVVDLSAEADGGTA